MVYVIDPYFQPENSGERLGTLQTLDWFHLL